MFLPVLLIKGNNVPSPQKMDRAKIKADPIEFDLISI